MVKKRDEIAAADKWDVEALYPSFDEWEKDLAAWGRDAKGDRWPELSAFRGRLADGPRKLKGLLTLYLELDRHLSKLHTYARLRHDEDVAEERALQAHQRILSIVHQFRESSAWIEPEILAIPEALWREFIEADDLRDYTVYLEMIVRLRAHTLSADKEALVASVGKALETASKAFSAFNNADLKFPLAEDSSGAQQELTHATFQRYLRSRDRKLRESAFKGILGSYKKFENTLCELVHGEVQGHVFHAKSRGYSSSLEAALFPNQIDTSVYSTLIETARSGLPALHRYYALRQSLLGYAEIHLYDMHVPLVQELELSFPYEEACELVIASMAPLGAEYQETLTRGLKEERWVDRYENERKRSGAYSDGCYDSYPYMLLNYQGTLSDVMTLAHEAGHSMHSHLSRRHQPYHYSFYAIFVAEVASIFNEDLLFEHLYARSATPEERAFLINQKIDDFRSTFFRQVMFAELELRLHRMVEEGMPLTPVGVNALYLQLCKEYFGPAVVVDADIEIEWARIPHFYYGFYVYQYATGLSAAYALAERVRQEGAHARAQYLQFLSSGSSQYPLELLARAGVDMRTRQPVQAAIERFCALVGELERMMQK
jgi:oligoendopeptidase F